MPSSLTPVLAVAVPGPGTRSTPVTDGEQSSLLQALAAVPDPRDRRGVRYRLASVLAAEVCATLAGAQTFAAVSDWLHDLDEAARARLGFTGDVPASTTVWRLLTRLDAGLLAQVLARWLRQRADQVLPCPPRARRMVIAVDGKTVRGARRADGGRVHLLSALDTSCSGRGVPRRPEAATALR